MRYLTVVYDPECGLCTRLSHWLQQQPKWIALRLVPSNLAPRIYPTLAPRIARQELVVVSDEGTVYLGDHAWLMCLYALRHYRSWAARLSRPSMLPFARGAFAILSSNRRQVSKWLGLMSDFELTAQLRTVNPPRCHGTGA
ncbi:MAG TPA: DCC1-like thiol-disulfide oxidoreductase family protein [Bryobacteraceae bacterium]|nr:DCC1-like thiol-disulfide oxidoreductase family protein [Bryobacteraceae bacterium]